MYFFQDYAIDYYNLLILVFFKRETLRVSTELSSCIGFESGIYTYEFKLFANKLQNACTRVTAYTHGNSTRVMSVRYN